MAAEAGYDGAEVMVTTDRRTQDAGTLNELSRRHGLPIPVLHGPFLLLTRTVFGTDLRQKVRRSVDLAKAIGSDTVVTHAPYRWERAYTRWLTDEVHRIEQDHGIRVTVENMFPVVVGRRALSFHGGGEPEDLTDFPYITLDTSHAGVTRRDLVGIYRGVREQVIHIHASNNAGNGRDSHALLGEGVLPVTAFLEELGASGFDQPVTLEVNFRHLRGDRKRLVETMRAEVELARECLARGRQSVHAPDSLNPSTQP